MSRSKGLVHAKHNVLYRQRRKLGLQPLKKPWDFICSAEVKEIAWKAYKLAAWQVYQDYASDPSEFDHSELRESFSQALTECFTNAICAHSVLEGGCWPVTDHTAAYRNYPAIWNDLCADMPSSWSPQYPIYEQLSQGGDGGHDPHGDTDDDVLGSVSRVTQ